MNRYISPKKWHHDPFGCCRLQCGDCSRERNQRAQCKMLDNRNRQKTRNHFESFWRLCPWPTKATHLELTLPPPHPEKQKESDRASPAAQCALRPGAQGWRPPDPQPARLPQRAGAARPAPRQSTLRVSAVSAAARKSPAGRALRRA